MAAYSRMSSNERQMLFMRLARESDFKAAIFSTKLGISLRQLQRIFERDYKCSPQQWLNDVRMQTAYELLKNSGQIKEVAYALGFKQTSHFSREFKRKYGHKPSALRQMGKHFKMQDADHLQIESFYFALINHLSEKETTLKPMDSISHILISRESRIGRSIQALKIEPRGYKVDFARNDEETINRTATVGYDLVILSRSKGKLSIFSTNQPD